MDTVVYSTRLLSLEDYIVEESSCKGRPDNVTWWIRGRDCRKGRGGGEGGGRGGVRGDLVLRLRMLSTHLSKGALGYLGCFEESLVATPNGQGGLQESHFLLVFRWTQIIIITTTQHLHAVQAGNLQLSIEKCGEVWIAKIESITVPFNEMTNSFDYDSFGSPRRRGRNMRA